MIFHVELSNIAPLDGRTDTTLRREVWEEAAVHLTTHPPIMRLDANSDDTWAVGVDLSDAIEFLRLVECVESEPDAFSQRLESRKVVGKHMLASELCLEVEGPKNRFESDPARAAGKFLQHLFLAMNAALPGSCRIEGRYLDDHEDTVHPPPDVHGHALESAFVHATERGWPQLRHVPFSRCWAWLEAELPYHLEVAEEPHHRALFTLLRLCGPGMAETDMMLHVAQVFEAFYSDGREGLGAILRARLELVLGHPHTHQKWFNKFYSQRSRIAHGSAPVLRPGSYAHDNHPDVVGYWDRYRVPLDEALAVLMAIVQDLVTHESRGYVFLQEALRVPRDGDSGMA